MTKLRIFYHNQWKKGTFMFKIYVKKWFFFTKKCFLGGLSLHLNHLIQSRMEIS